MAKLAKYTADKLFMAEAALASLPGRVISPILIEETHYRAWFFKCFGMWAYINYMFLQGKQNENYIEGMDYTSWTAAMILHCQKLMAWSLEHLSTCPQTLPRLQNILFAFGGNGQTG